MKRFLAALAALAAFVVVAAVVALVLWEGGPAVVPPVPPSPPPATPPTSDGTGPVFPPGRAPAPPPATADLESPPPPEAYPWEVPGWWHEIDRKFREGFLAWDADTLSVTEILERLEREIGFPVRVGPGLEAWAGESRISLASVRGPARGLVEALATRLNLEAVLTSEALVLHQRGRAPETKVVQAGRVQAAILEARERREGKRPPDQEVVDLTAQRVVLAKEKVRLRELARRLGEALGVPVYMDAPLWTVNPEMDLDGQERTLREVLDLLLAPLGAASDVTPRRVVLFRP